MAALSSKVGLLAIAATCCAQAITNPLSVDVTIALLSGGCDISTAPTLHVYGFSNTMEIFLDPGIWARSPLEAARFDNGTSSASLNYTISNPENWSPNTSYTGVYYQQLGGNTTDGQVATLLLAAYACAGGNNDCLDSGADDNAWLQWSCFAQGACYQTEYPIESWTLSTAVDGFSNVTGAERNDECELGTLHYANATKNNNTDMQGGGESLRAGSLIGTWSTVAVLGMLLWM